jgi:GT2 family glycosyltransferase
MSEVKERIGIGIITKDREEFFWKCWKSLEICCDHIDEYVVVNDGKPYSGTPTIYSNTVDLIQHTKNTGVAISKNQALQHLLDKGCDHIFLIEDDMLIKDPNIFEAYINASKKSGVQHMMFGYHGPANRNGVSKGKPHPRLVVDYGDFSLALNQHCVGAFCYYTKACLDDVGLIDEEFRNAFDHVSHSYELALKGYSTPYWWWADLANSTDYIEEQACSEESSSIKTTERQKEWYDNIRSSVDYFKSKYGVYPFGRDGVSDSAQADVVKFLKELKVNES